MLAEIKLEKIVKINEHLQNMNYIFVKILA